MMFTIVTEKKYTNAASKVAKRRVAATGGSLKMCISRAVLGAPLLAMVGGMESNTNPSNMGVEGIKIRSAKSRARSVPFTQSPDGVSPPQGHCSTVFTGQAIKICRDPSAGNLRRPPTGLPPNRTVNWQRGSSDPNPPIPTANGPMKGLPPLPKLHSKTPSFHPEPSPGANFPGFVPDNRSDVRSNGTSTTGGESSSGSSYTSLGSVSYQTRIITRMRAEKMADDHSLSLAKREMANSVSKFLSGRKVFKTTTKEEGFQNASDLMHEHDRDAHAGLMNILQSEEYLKWYAAKKMAADDFDTENGTNAQEYKVDAKLAAVLLEKMPREEWHHIEAAVNEKTKYDELIGKYAEKVKTLLEERKVEEYVLSAIKANIKMGEAKVEEARKLYFCLRYGVPSLEKTEAGKAIIRKLQKYDDLLKLKK